MPSSSSQMFPRSSAGHATTPAAAVVTVNKMPELRVLPTLESTAGHSRPSTARASSSGRSASAAATDPGSLGTLESGKRSRISSLLNNLPPVMFLICKYQEYKRNQQQLTKRKVTERELLHLNHKIDKLLQRLEEHKHDVAASPGEECVICISAKATMQTFPCAHRVVCRKCFVKTIQVAVSQRMLPLRCVVCRAKILRLNVSSNSSCKTAASTTAGPAAATATASSYHAPDHRDNQSISRSNQKKATHRVTSSTSATANVRGGGVVQMSRSSESSLRAIDEQDEWQELLPINDRSQERRTSDSASRFLPSVSFVSKHSGTSINASSMRRNDAAHVKGEEVTSLASSCSSRSSFETLVHQPSPCIPKSATVATDFRAETEEKTEISRSLFPFTFWRLIQRHKDLMSRNKWNPIY